jgi:ABC-type transporter Mla subunit MlaD
MVLDVNRRFAPFRSDASCSILPEGLISENYVECHQGSATANLPAGPGGVPIVPVEHTTAPVSLQDVLNVFALPTDVRLRALISELGLATAGRGQELNDLLRRANPALTQTRRTLALVNAERAELVDAVSQSNQVLRQVGARDGELRAFIDRAAKVANTTAAHATALGGSVQRLPAMLDAVRPGLRSLDRAAAKAGPLLDDLRASAPQLSSLTRTLPAFSAPGVSALHSLAAAAVRGRPALRTAAPIVAHLNAATQQVAPLATQIDQLLVSMRDTGGVEGTLRMLYTLATLSSSYDSVSHLINFLVQVAPQCLAAEGAGRDAPGCSHKWSAPGHGTVPINEPSCGPQAPEALWENVRCALPLPGGVPTAWRHVHHTHALAAPHVDAGTNAQQPQRQQPSERRPSPPLGDVQHLVNKLLKGQLPAGQSLPGAVAPALGGQAPSQARLHQLLDFLLK